jgi:ribosomal protein L30E
MSSIHKVAYKFERKIATMASENERRMAQQIASLSRNVYNFPSKAILFLLKEAFGPKESEVGGVASISEIAKNIKDLRDNVEMYLNSAAKNKLSNPDDHIRSVNEINPLIKELSSNLNIKKGLLSSASGSFLMGHKETLNKKQSAAAKYIDIGLAKLNSAAADIKEINNLADIGVKINPSMIDNLVYSVKYFSSPEDTIEASPPPSGASPLVSTDDLANTGKAK